MIGFGTPLDHRHYAASILILQGVEPSHYPPHSLAGSFRYQFEALVLLIDFLCS